MVMKLITLDTGSKANGYILTNGSEALIIEAGVKAIEAKKALGFRTSLVQGCIISHSHADHSRYAADYARAGIDVYAPVDVFQIPHNRNRPVMPHKKYKAGGFTFMPFDVPHDVVTYGYIIEHQDCGKVLFMTDTYLCEYKLPKVDHLIIEANYDDNILDHCIEEGDTHPAMKDRLMTSHMEISTAITYCTELKPKNIILIHLSDGHSNEAEFIDRVTGATGAIVVAARKGLEINLNDF